MRPAQTLYEINAAVWLYEQPWPRAEAPDLADIPQSIVDGWARAGVDAVWFMGVWKRSAASRQICLGVEELYRIFAPAPPEEIRPHIIGSPFSVVDYSLDPMLGDSTTLERLRKKLNARGIRLILDFVPNHLAVDHPWVQSHPERFVRGTEVELDRAPCNYFRTDNPQAPILAHGRDPYFAGWTDTVQINICSRQMRRVMTGELQRIAQVCDGVRCDMAMLAANAVFRRTWGDLSLLDYPVNYPPEFWNEAISAVKERHPDFLFVAEVYWGMERQMLDMGFDYAYDKTLYDRARSGDGTAIRRHLADTLDFQDRLVRFLENHDETRAAEAFGPRQEAAATFLHCLPGLHLFHEGQFEGRKVRVPVQLKKRPDEAANPKTARFYKDLLELAKDPVLKKGEFHPLDVRPAWEDNPSHHGIVTAWRSLDGQHRFVAANIGETQAQAYTDIPKSVPACETLDFQDLLGDANYQRPRKELLEKGLYLDLEPGERRLFQVRSVK